MIDHKYLSAVADDADATTVSPSNWNDDHQVLRTVAADVVTVANSSQQVCGDYEVAAGSAFELSADSVLEIT